MKFILSLSLYIFALSACAQVQPLTSEPSASDSTGTFKLLYIIPGQYAQVEVDALGNIYLLAEGQLKKLSPAGDSIAVFNDVRRFGNPTYIDVSNPFKTLVYFKNFTTIVVLDRFLTIRNTINLRKENIFRANAIGATYDNLIWVFDEQDFKLKKIDDEGKLLFESNDMRNVTGTAPLPAKLIDSEGFVYLYDTSKGFLILDYYGALKNTLPFKNWESVSVSRGLMYGFNNNVLNSYELKSLQIKQYPLPKAFTGYLSVRASNGKVYLRKENQVEIYEVK